MLQRKRRNDHSEYDVFAPNDMNDKPRVLGNTTKLRSHVHALFSGLQSPFYHQAVVPKKGGARLYQRIFLRDRISAIGDRGCRAPTGMLHRELVISLCTCSWKLSTNNGRKMCTTYVCGRGGQYLLAVGDVMGKPLGHVDYRATEECYEPLVAKRCDGKCFACRSVKTTLWWIEGRFEEENTAETKAEVGGMTDSPYIQLLYGEETGAEYPHLYVSNCNGIFTAA